MSGIPIVRNTTTTATSGNGTTATLTLSSSIGVKTGDTIVVSGVVPASYNGRFTVTSVATNPVRVSYASKATGSQSKSGTVTTSSYTNSVSTVSASGNGTYATLRLSGPLNAAIGDSITVSGMSPSGYNGTWTVTESSDIEPYSVTFRSSLTSAQISAGTVKISKTVFDTGDWGLVGQTFGGLETRTRSSVEATLRGQVSKNSSWGNASSVLFGNGFLDSSLPFPVAILKGIGESITRAIFGPSISTVEDVLSAIQAWFEGVIDPQGKWVGDVKFGVMDGQKTIGNFLDEVWRAITGQTGSNKTVSNVAGALGDLSETANLAYENATSAGDLVEDVVSSGSNLIKNGGFENIFFQQLGSLFSLAQKKSGSKSLQITGNGFSTVSYVLLSDETTQRFLKVTPGDILYAEFYVFGATGNKQTSGGQGAVRMLFEPFDGANNALPTSIFSATASTALNGVWTKLGGYVTIPPDAARLKISLQLLPTVNAFESYFFDDVVVREVTLASTATAAAGSAQTSADAANNNAVLAQGAAQVADDKAVAADNKAKSASELALEVISSSANLIKNPGFENIFFQQAGSMFTLLQKRSGLFSLMLTGSASGAKYTLLSDTGTSRALSVSAGDTLYAEVWVRGASGNQTSGAADSIKMVFEPLNGSGTAIAGGAQVAAGSVFSTSPSAALNGDWQKLSGYVTMPTGTASLRISLELTSAITAGKNYFFDDVVVRELTLARSAFIESGLAQSAAGAASNSAALAQSAAATADGKAVVAQSAAATADGKAVAAQGSANTAKALANSALQAGPNLAVNPGFENTSIPLAGDGSYSTAQARTGSRSVVMTGASDWRTTWLTADEDGIFRVPVSPGDSYYAEFWVRGSGASTGLVLIAAEVRNASGTVIDYPLVGEAVSTSLNNTWTKVSGIIKMPENAVTASFFVQLHNAVPSGTFYFDDVSVFRVTESIKTNQALYSSNTPNLTINSGAVPGLEGSKITSGTVAEARVENLSATRSTANRVAAVTGGQVAAQTNLCADPDCSRPEVWWPSGGDCTIAVSNEYSRSGPSSLKMTLTATSDGYPAFALIQEGKSQSVKLKCSPGDVFYAEIWVRKNPANVQNKALYLQFLSHDSVSGGADYASGTWNNTTQYTPTNTWQKMSGYFTIPNGRDGLSIYVGTVLAGANTFGESYYIDDIVVKEITQTNAINQALYSQNTPALTINSAAVPGLEGSKITSGTVAEERIAALSQGKITGLPGTLTGIDNKATAAQATANAAAARLEEKIAGGASITTNPTFSDTSQYLYFGWTYTTEQKLFGTHSVKRVSPNSASGYTAFAGTANSTDQIFVPCTPGQVFYLEVYIYGANSNQYTSGDSGFGLEAIFYDSAKNVVAGLGAAFANISAIGKNTWKKFSGYLTAPAGSAYIIPRVSHGHSINTNGDVHYIDGFRVVDVTESYNAKLVADAAQAQANTATTNAAFAQSAATSVTEAFTNALKTSVNLCMNPGFEDDQAAIGWQTSQLSYDTGIKRTGSRSLRVKTASPDDVYFYLGGTRFGETYFQSAANRKYYVEGWVYSSTGNVNASNPGNATVYLGVWFYDSNSAYRANGTIWLPDSAAIKGQWVKFSGTVSAPDDSSIVYARALGVTPGWAGYGTNNFYYVDDVVVKDVTEAYDADQRIITTNQALYSSNNANPTINSGAVPGLEGSKITSGTVAEERVQNLSTIRNATIQLSTSGSNLAPDPSFENTSAYFFTAGNAVLSTDYARTGTRSARVTAAGGYNTFAALATNGVNNMASFACREGDVFYFEGWVRAHPNNVGGGSVYVSCEIKSGSTVIDYRTPSGAVVDTNNPAFKSGFVKISGYVTVPANGTGINPLLLVGWNVPAGDRYYWDDVTFREVTESTVAKSIAVSASQSGSNFATNPGFENTALWMDTIRVSGGFLGEYSTEQKRSGARSLKLLGGYNYRDLFSNDTQFIRLPCNPGDRFYAEIWVRGHSSNAAAGEVYLQADCYDTNNVRTEFLDWWKWQNANSRIGADTTDLRNNWFKLYGEFVIPANTRDFVITAVQSGGSNIYYWDDFVVKQVTTSYLLGENAVTSGKIASGAVTGEKTAGLDGSKITSGQVAEGRVENLTSTKNTANQITSIAASGSNIVFDPSFENTAIQMGYGNVTYSTDAARTGIRSIKSVGNGNWNGFSLPASVAQANIAVRCRPGDIFYQEVWVRSATTSSNTTGYCYIQVPVFRTDGSFLTYASAVGNAWKTEYRVNELSNTVWQKLYFYCEIPADGAFATFACSLSPDVPIGFAIYWDDIVIREVTDANVTTRALYSSNTPGSTILTGAVPQIDGSKINTGTVPEDRVQGLTTIKDTANLARNLAQDGMASGANLIPNSSFESTQYIFWAQSTFTRSNEIARTGFWSVRCAPDNVYREFIPATTSTSSNIIFKAVAGDSYYVEMWVYGRSTNSNTTSGFLNAQFVGMDLSGVFTEEGSNKLFVGPTLKNKWTKLSGIYTFKNLNTAQFYLQIAHDGSIASGDIYFIDDVVLREVSASNLSRDLLRSGANILPNPGFESLSLPVVRGGTSWSITTEAARSGSRSAKLGPGIVNWNHIVLSLDDSGAVTIPASFNDVYYIEFLIRGHSDNSNTNAGQVYIFLDMTDRAGNYLGSRTVWVQLQPSLKNTWTKVSGHAKLDHSDVAFIKVMLVNSDGIPVNDIYYVDDVVVREVTAAATTNQALYNANTPSSTILAGAVPGLEGSKITTGTVAEERVQNLPQVRSTVEGVATSSNMLISPNFDDTSIARFSYAGTLQYTNAAGYVHQGSHSITWQASNNWNGISLAPTQTNEFYSVREGESIGASVRIKRDANNNNSVGNVALYIRWLNRNGQNITYVADSWNGNLNSIYNASFPSGWQDMVNFGTCPAGANALQIMLINNPETPSGNKYYVDSAAVYRMANPAEISSSAITQEKIANGAVTGEKTAQLDGSKITGGLVAESRVENLPAIKTTANTTKTAVDQFSEIVSGLVVTPINNAVTSFSNWFSNLLGWQSNTQNFQISAITGGTATKQPVWVCRYPIADVSYPEILNTLFTTFGTTDSVAAASGDASSTVTGAASAGTAHTHSTTHTHPGVAHSHSIAQQTANPALRVCAPGQSGGGFITITQNAVYDTMGMVARRDSSGTPNNVFMELFRVRPDGQMERIRSVDISSQLTTTVQYIEVSIAGQVVQPGERYMVRIRNSSTNAENVNVRGARSLGGSIFSGFDTGTAAVSEKTTYTSSEISTYTTDTARWALFGTTTQVANDQSFSDDFNRSNLGTLWSPASTTGSNQIVLVSGKSQFGGTTNGDQHAIYLRPTGSNNQRVEANITPGLSGTYGGILMHCSRDGGQVVYLAVSAFGSKLFTGNWTSLTERASSATGGDGLWALYYQSSDNRYYVQKNGAQVFSWQDANNFVTRGADFRYGGIRHRRQQEGLIQVNSGAIDNWTLRDFTA